MRLKVLGALLIVGLVLGVSGIVFATNGYKTQFNTRYGTTGSTLDQCILCHSANPGTLSNVSGNPYGVELQNNGLNFAAAEPLDSDGDGFSNLAEITARTFPGNAASKSATPSARNIVDFDGDGKTDDAFYRSSTGVWYVRPSSGAVSYAVSWGGDPSDIPVAGDYDGDKKTDIAVYRASTGFWYVKPSTGVAAYGVGWGGAGDLPVTK